MSLRAAFPLAVLFALSSFTALACGDSEAGLVCDDDGRAAENGATWMLKRVVTAVETDRDRALDAFTHGTGGFRTADTYVFCVGPDGVMSAHPNPILQGQNVRDLHDRTGNYFIRAMMQQAQPGEVSVIRYLFPKPGGTVPLPKTTYYTRAGDQVCAVGVYDGDETLPATSTSPQERVEQLRRKLDAEIPASVRPDWTAFLDALSAETGEKEAAITQARERLKAVEIALSPSSKPLRGE
jgi:hypothetical protein